MQLQEIIEQNRETLNENEAGFFDIKKYQEDFLFRDRPLMGVKNVIFAKNTPIYSIVDTFNMSNILKQAQRDVLLQRNH